MTDAALQKAITLTELDGRIAELEEQRNGALARCARLAGEKASLVDLLRQSATEIGRLNAIINNGDAIEAKSLEETARPAIEPAAR